jgi:hypothetical protein
LSQFMPDLPLQVGDVNAMCGRNLVAIYPSH